MDELYMEMLELSSKGYYCSQVIIKIILELERKNIIGCKAAIIDHLNITDKNLQTYYSSAS